MFQKSAKSATELESMITAELREHPECESAGVKVIKPTGVAWDTVLIRSVPQLNDECEAKLALVLIRSVPQLNDECEAKLAEITSRLRQEFDLVE